MDRFRTGQRGRTGRTAGTLSVISVFGLLVSGCVADSIFGTEDARIRPDDRPLALPPPAEPVLTAERDPNALPPVYDPLTVPESDAPAPSAAPSGRVQAAPLEAADTPEAPASAGQGAPILTSPTVSPEPVGPSVQIEDTQLPPAPAASGAGGGFWVQVGAFAVPGNAERLADRLSALGSVDVGPISSGGRTLLRVRLGPYGSRQAVAEALARVHAAGYPDALVTR